MEPIRPLVCATCNVPVQLGTPDPQSNTEVVCPGCGTSDTYENAVREAAQHFAREELGKALRGAISGSGGFTFNGVTGPKFRFSLGDAQG